MKKQTMLFAGVGVLLGGMLVVQVYKDRPPVIKEAQPESAVGSGQEESGRAPGKARPDHSTDRKGDTPGKSPSRGAPVLPGGQGERSSSADVEKIGRDQAIPMQARKQEPPGQQTGAGASQPGQGLRPEASPRQGASPEQVRRQEGATPQAPAGGFPSVQARRQTATEPVGGAPARSQVLRPVGEKEDALTLGNQAGLGRETGDQELFGRSLKALVDLSRGGDSQATQELINLSQTLDDVVSLHEVVRELVRAGTDGSMAAVLDTLGRRLVYPVEVTRILSYLPPKAYSEAMVDRLYQMAVDPVTPIESRQYIEKRLSMSGGGYGQHKARLLNNPAN